MELGPHRFPGAGDMRRSHASWATPRIDGIRISDGGGAALFCVLSTAFVCLFAFVLWYCPRHL